jgi:hypothetical protein
MAWPKKKPALRQGVCFFPLALSLALDALVFAVLLAAMLPACVAFAVASLFIRWTCA